MEKDKELMIKCMAAAKEIWDEIFPGGGPYNGEGIATIATELFRWRKAMILVTYPAGISKEALNTIRDVIRSTGFAHILFPDSIQTEVTTPVRLVAVESLEDD